MRGAWSCSIRSSRGLVASCLAALTLLAASAWGQYPNPAPPSQPDRPTPGTSSSRPHFAADAVVQPGDTGVPEVRIDYRLPRTELLFERAPGGFEAAYQIRVIFRSKNKQVAGDEFSRELKVATYAETNMQGQDILDHVALRVPPGKYVIQIDMSDLKAENLSTASLEFEVPSAPTAQIWFTDLTLGTVGDSASADTARSFTPNPSRHYADNIVRLAAELQVVDDRPAGSADSTYRLRYQVLGSAPQPLAQGDTAVAKAGPRTHILVRPRFGPLEPGLYRFAVELIGPAPGKSSGKKPLPVRREKTFTVDPSAVSLWADPNGAIDVLRYIASDQELSEMNTLSTPEQQKEFWEEFWKRRDPTPGTPENERMDEFYKRVQYANQHFAIGEPGWKTDMGRIYIINGNPDEVVRNPFNVDRPPEEIWYYYRDRKTFVFVDREGFGRYELDPTRSKQG